MDPLAHLDDEFAALPRATRWWVALSGGVDSLTLLHRLVAWAAKHPAPTIAAVHINHGIADSANDWAAACQSHCERLGVPLTVLVVDPLDPHVADLERVARDARYAAFEQTLGEGELLLQAHHQDDLAETVLFRLIRGSGAQGLAAIPRSRPLGVGTVVRPLLNTPRTAIAAWAAEQGIEPVEDPANSDQRFDRNYLRHTVLPLIEARWPGYRQAMARSAELQRTLLADLDIDASQVTTNRCDEPALVVGEAQSVPSLASLLHRWLVAQDVMPPDHDRLMEYARQVLTAAEDRLPSLALNDAVLYRWRGQVHLSVSGTAFGHDEDELTVGTSWEGAWGRLHWVECDPGLPAGLVLYPRSREAGEYVAPMGRPGRSLTQWSQECGLPPWWRDSIPVCCDADGEVVVIPGCGLATAAKSLISAEKRGWMPVWRPPRATAQLSR